MPGGPSDGCLGTWEPRGHWLCPRPPLASGDAACGVPCAGGAVSGRWDSDPCIWCLGCHGNPARTWWLPTTETSSPQSRRPRVPSGGVGRPVGGPPCPSGSGAGALGLWRGHCRLRRLSAHSLPLGSLTPAPHRPSRTPVPHVGPSQVQNGLLSNPQARDLRKARSSRGGTRTRTRGKDHLRARTPRPSGLPPAAHSPCRQVAESRGCFSLAPAGRVLSQGLTSCRRAVPRPPAPSGPHPGQRRVSFLRRVPGELCGRSALCWGQTWADTAIRLPADKEQVRPRGRGSLSGAGSWPGIIPQGGLSRGDSFTQVPAASPPPGTVPRSVDP